MNELLADIKRALEDDPRMQPFKAGGGIMILSELEDYPHQTKTPNVVLLDTGAATCSHLSSGVLDRVLPVEVHVIQRQFEKHEMSLGGLMEMGIEDLAKIVRKILTNNRLNAKYVSAFWTGDGKPKPIKNDNPQLMGKPLTFDYRRIESP